MNHSHTPPTSLASLAEDIFLHQVGLGNWMMALFTAIHVTVDPEDKKMLLEFLQEGVGRELFQNIIDRYEYAQSLSGVMAV